MNKIFRKILVGTDIIVVLILLALVRIAFSRFAGAYILRHTALAIHTLTEGAGIRDASGIHFSINQYPIPRAISVLNTARHFAVVRIEEFCPSRRKGNFSDTADTAMHASRSIAFPGVFVELPCLLDSRAVGIQTILIGGTVLLACTADCEIITSQRNWDAEVIDAVTNIADCICNVMAMCFVVILTISGAQGRWPHFKEASTFNIAIHHFSTAIKSLATCIMSCNR